MPGKKLISRIKGRLDRQFIEPVRRARRARANVDRVLNPLFVTGAMGSGTTLLGLELGQRFETSGIIDESCLAVPKDSYLHVEPIERHRLIGDYYQSLLPRRDWQIDVGRKQMLLLYRERAERGVGPIVDKAANSHLCRSAFLLRCFSEAPMLVIFRDPVANIEGFRRKWPTFGNDSLVENISFYRTIHEAFLETRARNPGRTLLLSYEALTMDPDATFDLVRESVGLVPVEEAAGIEFRANEIGQGVRNVGSDGIQIVANANEKALAAVPPEEASSISTALGDLHTRMLREADNV